MRPSAPTARCDVDARLVGLGSGAAAVLARAPLIVVVVVAAASTAIVRAL